MTDVTGNEIIKGDVIFLTQNDQDYNFSMSDIERIDDYIIYINDSDSANGIVERMKHQVIKAPVEYAIKYKLGYRLYSDEDKEYKLLWKRKEK